MAEAPAHGLGAIAHADALVDAAEGAAHGVATDAQLAADLQGVVALRARSRRSSVAISKFCADRLCHFTRGCRAVTAVIKGALPLQTDNRQVPALENQGLGSAAVRCGTWEAMPCIRADESWGV